MLTAQMKTSSPILLYPAVALAFAGLVVGLIFASDKMAYEVLRDFSEMIGTLSAGLLGFWGIMHTLDRNSRNDANKAASDADKERGAIRTAILGELRTISVAVAAAHSAMQDKDHNLENFLATSEFLDGVQPRVYEAVLNKIGTLTSEEVTRIVASYSHLDLLSAYARGFSKNAPEKYSAYFSVLESARQQIDEARNLLEKTTPAVS